MASGFTNRGLFLLVQKFFRDADTFYVALITAAVAPSFDTNTFGQLTEIADGNGYTTGGIALTGDATDFDVLTEDDATDVGYVQVRDLTWTASGGAIPASGDGASYAVLLDDNATVANRQVIAWADLTQVVTREDGQVLTLTNTQFQGGHP